MNWDVAEPGYSKVFINFVLFLEFNLQVKLDSKESNFQSKADILRRKAEDLLMKNPAATPSPMSVPEILKLVHELEVHQVELHLQNEELRHISEAAEAEADLYRELYDFAPTGYFTLSGKGDILKSNLCGAQMLGTDRTSLLKHRFGLFVTDHSRPVFNLFFNSIFSSKTRESCEITLVAHGNLCIYAHLTGMAINDGEQCLLTVIDISDHVQVETRMKLSTKILNLLNTQTPFHETIDHILSFIQETYGFDAIGIRVKSGDDYPYFSHHGFSEDFLKSENSIAERTAEGRLCLDGEGKPCLECTCGLVLSGKTDPSSPLFTEGGSFWTNDSMVILGISAEQDPRTNPRNRCIYDGFQSFALIPIHHSGEIVGLLQLNDRKKDCFTPTLISFFEGIGDMIGSSLLRKQSEEALHESEMLYRNLVENLPDGIYKSTHAGKFVDVNPAMVKMFGYSGKEEMMNIDIKAQLYFSPDDRESVILNENMIKSGIYRMKKRDGSEIWVEDHGWLTLDETTNILYHEGIMMDITERRRSEEILVESEKKYRDLFENAQEGIFRTNLNGSILYVNPALAKIFGFESPDELMNTRNSIAKDFYFDPGERDKFLKMMDESGFVKGWEYEVKHKDGHKIWLYEDARGIKDENGRIQYFDGFVVDITERKQAEEEIRKLNETLENRIAERTAQLESLNNELVSHIDEVEQFTYIASHDLQEPLRTLTNFTELIKEDYAGKLGEDGNKYIDFINNAAVRMRELVSGLVDYSILGKESVKTTVDCNKIVKDVLFDIQDSITGCDAKITIHELPALIGYATELRLLFQNLIVNAIKFRKKGTIPEINISAESNVKEWIFKIEDNGIGIDDKNKEKIFIIFKRMHNRSEYKGAGIGLAHCKKIVELHGGKIWVKSTPGTGSIFMFTIPKT